MTQKYEVRDDRRIVALREGPWGPAGTVGGYLYDNAVLSHDGGCWIYDGASMHDTSTMRDNSTMRGGASMSGNSRMDGFASMDGFARMGGNSIMGGNARLCGYAIMRGGAIYSGTHQWIEVWADCDGYSKCLVEIDGVAYIGAGCLWLSLAEARRHWANRPDRRTTLALLEGAAALARLRGLREE